MELKHPERKYDLSDKYCLEKIRRRCLSICRQKNIEHQTDEFYGYVIEHFLKGRRATFDQLFVDFTRETIGRTGTKRNVNNPLSLDLFLRQRNMDDVHTSNHPKDNGIIELSYEKQIHDNMLAYAETINNHNMVNLDRSVFLLYFKHDIALWEIGMLFGFSESRASQILKRAVDKVKKHFLSPTSGTC